MLKIKKAKPLICLPTFHSKIEWIERSIQSVINQTHENFDCMLVKDCCSKHKIECLECNNCLETKEYCLNVCKKDKRFNFYSLPLHCSGAGWGPRNFAIMNSKNNLICYLDDDNWYEKEHVELLLKSIIENNSDMAFTGTKIYNKDLNFISERMHLSKPKEGYIDTSEIMHKRWLIEKFGGWRYVKKGNDWDLISRWKNYKWSHTNKITLNFFLREGCGIHRK